MAQNIEPDPYMQPLFDLLTANPQPQPVPVPRRRPGSEPITQEQSDAQRLDIAESMRQLGMKIDPVAWEKMLAESPASPNIEDRRNQTVASMKEGFRKQVPNALAAMTKEERDQFERDLTEWFGPDEPLPPPEVNPRGPK